MREAACSCGQLRVTVEGEPVRISMCHCFECQRQTGSAFSMQARYPKENVRVEGRYTDYVRLNDEAGEERTFHFCPDCGSTVFYQTDPELIAVRIGAFADPTFPPPWFSVWEEGRRHPWVTPPEGAERD